MAIRTKLVLLIVEDDEVLLRALYMLFHKSKYTIASATDGAMAVQMAQRLKPDLILLDLLLPKMDGFEVLRIIKADQALKATPVIVLSNLGDISDIEKAKTLGAEEYFIKANTDLAVLESKVNKLLESKLSPQTNSSVSPTVGGQDGLTAA